MKSFTIKKPGTYKISILAYRAGAGNPFSAEGTLWYERTFYAHKNMGAEKEYPLCPKKCRNKPCPACELLGEMDQDPNADPKTKNGLFAQRKQAFLIFDHDNPADGVQLWEIAYHNFGKQLDQRINAADEEDNYHKFFRNDDGGLMLKLGAVEEASGFGGKYIKVATIDFKQRAEPLPSKLLKKLPCLDELIDASVPKYAHIEELLGGGRAIDEDEDEPKRKKRSRDDEDEPLDDDAGFDDDDDDDPPPRSRKKSRRDEEDDDDDEPAPRSRKRDRDAEEDEDAPFDGGKKKKPSRDEDDDDDDPPPRKRPARDDDEDDDDPPPKKRKSRDDDEDDDDDPPPRRKKSRRDEDDDE
jgi:hypothetical protein